MATNQVPLLLGIIWLSLIPYVPVLSSEVPKFAEPIPNITAAVGREAILQCTIDNLDIYKVAWIKLDTQTLLSYHTHVITRDNRLRVSNSNHRQWFLHIKDVMVVDRGHYMCQINTEPMISQLGYLDVMVPPSIVEENTSTDTTVDERSRVSLRCLASGYPTPAISWRREDGKDINLGPMGNQKSSVPRVEGEFLNLTQVTREDMAAYLCIASNGVPPSVSKRILLQVNFQPKIRVTNQMVGAAALSDVVLGCRLEASPRPLTSWIRNDGVILLNNRKYEITEEEDSYKIVMQLRIKDLNGADFGPYKCVAKNTLGEKEGFVRLIEITPPTSAPHSTQMYDVFVPIHREHQTPKNETNAQRKEFGVPESNSLRDDSNHLSSEKQLSPAKEDSRLGDEEQAKRSNQAPTQRIKTDSASTSKFTTSCSSILAILVLNKVLL